MSIEPDMLPSTHDHIRADAIELRELCERFFAQADPSTRQDLDRFLLTQDNYGGYGWLIDMLALTARQLRRQEEEDRR